MKPSIKYSFGLWFALYFALLLFNLDRIPVAWTDETQLLDPAANWVFNNSFSSLLMPYASSTLIYASSLPFIQWVYILFLKLFGMNMFFIRLPMVIAALASGILLIKLLNRNQIKKAIALLICFLFLSDINTYEMIRAGRVELFSGFLLLCSLWFYHKKDYLKTILSLSFLLLTHPATWAFCLVMFLFSWFRSSSFKEKLLLPFLVLLPTIFWLWTLNFNLYAIQDQLLAQGTHHNPKHSEGNFISNLFWFRFYPFWKAQPYLIVMHWIAIGLAIKSLFLNKSIYNKTIAIAFLSTEVFMAIMLATHHRYNVILTLLILLLLAEPIQKLYSNKPKLSKVALLIFIPLALFPFASRNLIGLAERQERNPDKILEWLNNNLPESQHKNLLGGSDIGQYFAIEKKNLDFFEVIYPQNINFNNYDKIYILSHQAPKGNWLKINQYNVEPSKLGKWLSKYHRGQNYNGLTLYQANNVEDIKLHTHEYDISY